MPPSPEKQARDLIDKLLQHAGWSVQDVTAADLAAARCVAIPEFPLLPGGKARGVIEANKQSAIVDMIATGTDIKPVEVVIFMRSV